MSPPRQTSSTGKVRLYNNYTRNWSIYAVCASVEAQILSQCNIYGAGQKKLVFKYMPEKAADRKEVNAGRIRSEGDMFLNGTQLGLLDAADAQSVFDPLYQYPSWSVEPSSLALKGILPLCTGWQAIPRSNDC